MGNGQCHDCCGNEPGKWYPHPCVETPEEEGHQPNCAIAKSLESLGEKVVYATLTDEMKKKKVAECLVKLVVDTIAGVKWPESTIARKVQEDYWKEHGKETN